jgi:hypothetical protein
MISRFLKNIEGVNYQPGYSLYFDLRDFAVWQSLHIISAFEYLEFKETREILMNAKQNSFQNAFQNAGQLHSFSYNEIGNQTSTWLVLILALIMLIALLRSEARTRTLIEQLAKYH